MTDAPASPPPQAHRPEPVSATMRRAKADARSEHVTIGQVREDAAGRVTIDCSCGMPLTNGPDWTVDEHIRLHRAEARYLALSAVAPAGMPRLIAVDADRLPRVD
ncbi:MULTISPECIES: hypothetical protein [Cellulosimicrobium]|uniref:hypothetical protein n=1 Tax=Cellulosimicrobium TaxID=157920 RepID=UPI00278BDBEC|nr:MULTISPECIES: hypothetical protein [Cellulosimicrobium]